jgi:hypothetical protein
VSLASACSPGAVVTEAIGQNPYQAVRIGGGRPGRASRERSNPSLSAAWYRALRPVVRPQADHYVRLRTRRQVRGRPDLTRPDHGLRRAAGAGAIPAPVGVSRVPEAADQAIIRDISR